MQTHRDKIQAFVFSLERESVRLGTGSQSHQPTRRVGCVPAGDPAAHSLFSRTGSSREIRIQAIFSLVPPTVSHQGKQKSGVLSIYFSV